MNNLDISEAKASKLSKLEDAALEILQSCLDGNRDFDEISKSSLSIMSVIAKNRQTSTHRKAMEFSMACSIATEEQKKKYIAATSPQVLKALTGD